MKLVATRRNGRARLTWRNWTAGDDAAGAISRRPAAHRGDAISSANDGRLGAAGFFSPKNLNVRPEHVREPRQLFEVDVYAANDFGLQRFNLDRKRARLPN